MNESDFNQLAEDTMTAIEDAILLVAGRPAHEDFAAEVTRVTGKESRIVVLGHLQRGGSPTQNPAKRAHPIRRVTLAPDGVSRCMTPES